jgi:ribulose-5-phosphate 4-epimerase/fuculose-1-phosphate aldolase
MDNLEFPSMRETVSEAEWETRLDLAALYRVAAHMGWQDMALNHFTARLPDAPDHFLIKPTDLMFEEVTASSLLCYTLGDELVHPSSYSKSPASFNIHGSILKARPDVNCVMHLHTDSGAAVSTLECGLLFISQYAMRFWGKVGYHNYQGLVHGDGLDECQQMVNDLGDKTVLIMNNHGTMVTGRSIAETFSLNHYLERACKIQMDALNAGRPIIEPSEEVVAEIAQGWPEKKPNAPLAGKRDWGGVRRQMDRLYPEYRS